MVDSVPGCLVQFWAQKLKIGSDFLGSCTSGFYLESRSEDVHVTDSEMAVEEPAIEVKSKELEPSAVAPVDVLILTKMMTVQFGRVLV